MILTATSAPWKGRGWTLCSAQTLDAVVGRANTRGVPPMAAAAIAHCAHSSATQAPPDASASGGRATRASERRSRAAALLLPPPAPRGRATAAAGCTPTTAPNYCTRDGERWSIVSGSSGAHSPVVTFCAMRTTPCAPEPKSLRRHALARVSTASDRAGRARGWGCAHRGPRPAPECTGRRRAQARPTGRALGAGWFRARLPAVLRCRNAASGSAGSPHL